MKLNRNIFIKFRKTVRQTTQLLVLVAFIKFPEMKGMHCNSAVILHRQRYSSKIPVSAEEIISPNFSFLIFLFIYYFVCVHTIGWYRDECWNLSNFYSNLRIDFFHKVSLLQKQYHRLLKTLEQYWRVIPLKHYTKI